MSRGPLKILFVAFSDSIHVARWIQQLSDQGWDIRLFPSVDHGIVCRELPDIDVYDGKNPVPASMAIESQSNPVRRRIRKFWRVFFRPRLFPAYRRGQLRQAILEFQPDIVHSLEFQSAGYLVAEARKYMDKEFPSWISTNWGSDIYHFRNFPEHQKEIRAVLSSCDYYSCECRRDVCLAQGMGLRGTVLPVIPNAGGFNIAELEKYRCPGPASLRKKLVLKGYQHWVGRALIGVAALEQCADLLAEYEITIHSPSTETRKAVKNFARRTGISVTILERGTRHKDILRMYGEARVALGLSLSDGVSTSFLEAIAMGAFPVQSFTSCADEWVEDGKSGFLVPPEDVDAVAAALRRALTDDELVDRAAEINYETTRQRLDQQVVGSQAIGYYHTVARDRGVPCHRTSQNS